MIDNANVNNSSGRAPGLFCLLGVGICFRRNPSGSQNRTEDVVLASGVTGWGFCRVSKIVIFNFWGNLELFGSFLLLVLLETSESFA